MFVLSSTSSHEREREAGTEPAGDSGHHGDGDGGCDGDPDPHQTGHCIGDVGKK